MTDFFFQRNKDASKTATLPRAHPTPDYVTIPETASPENSERLARSFT